MLRRDMQSLLTTNNMDVTLKLLVAEVIKNMAYNIETRPAAIEWLQ